MSEERFAELRTALVEVGLSRRSARRAVAEIEDHFHELVLYERNRGTSDREARVYAHELLGTDAILVQRYAARPELHAYWRRRPALWFILAPLGAYVALAVAAMSLVVGMMSASEGYLYHMHVAPQTSRLIDLLIQLVVLGVLPAGVAAAFAARGWGRGIAWRWPVAGIVLLSVIASLINVDVSIVGGGSPSSAGAGIGFSMRTLWPQLGRTAAVATLAAVTIWVAMRRGGQGSDALN